MSEEARGNTEETAEAVCDGKLTSQPNPAASNSAVESSSMAERSSNGSLAAPSSALFSDNSVVWVRLGQSWWPGIVVALDRCPADFMRDLKKTPLAVVKFFDENGFVDIHKTEHIYPYNCERKKEFIKKGLNLRSIQNKEELFKKFESDVLMAQKLTGGQPNVFTEIEEDSNKRRIDYSNLGFGPPKPKKKKEEDAPRRLGSDISQAVRYKGERSNAPPRLMKLQHKLVIMEQPHVENMKEDLNRSCNSYTCKECGFSCSRLGVIVWHNKGHLKTVMNYDTGIRIPGRKKRRPKVSKLKQKLKKDAALVAAAAAADGLDHTKSNGHMEPSGNSLEAKQLLMDWDDDDDNIENNEADDPEQGEEEASDGASAENSLNNGHADGVSDEKIVADTTEGRSVTERMNRRPMRGVEDLNSAFDALLADTPNSSNHTALLDSSFTNNQSDSDASDWEKYYTKNEEDDEDDDEDEREEEEGEGDEVKESDIKSLCEVADRDDSDDNVTSTVTNGTLHDKETSGDEEKTKDFTSVNGDLTEGNGNVADSESCSPEPSNQTEEGDELEDTAEEEEDGEEEDEEEEDGERDSKEAGRSSSLSSSPSNSGPAFMLVAVDAHGNNVPMPALTDRNHSSNLVAVEASMEDGTSRTLYIDPAYLEPNVDLSNLMLHIDNSGQETVIIPSSSSQETAANATPPQDSSSRASPCKPSQDSSRPSQDSSSTSISRPSQDSSSTSISRPSQESSSSASLCKPTQDSLSTSLCKPTQDSLSTSLCKPTQDSLTTSPNRPHDSGEVTSSSGTEEPSLEPCFSLPGTDREEAQAPVPSEGQEEAVVESTLAEDDKQ